MVTCEFCGCEKENHKEEECSGFCECTTCDKKW
jgi:hypothetical protein